MLGSEPVQDETVGLFGAELNHSGSERGDQNRPATAVGDSVGERDFRSRSSHACNRFAEWGVHPKAAVCSGWDTPMPSENLPSDNSLSVEARSGSTSRWCIGTAATPSVPRTFEALQNIAARVVGRHVR